MNVMPLVGLLPCFLKLYDEVMPEARATFQPLVEKVKAALEADGLQVVPADVCRLEPEFRDAISLFEKHDVDAIATVHLAYSPSLASVDLLIASGRPILLIDTTMDFAFGRDAEADRILYNHGVHGVQDLASMLRQRGKHFEIVAGHVDESGVLGRAAAMVRAAHGARSFRAMRTLRIGRSFEGMGDFAIDESVLRTQLGIVVDNTAPSDLAPHFEKVADAEVEEELKQDEGRFKMDLPAEVHARSVRVGLALRRVLERGPYGAFTMNFVSFDTGEGPINTVPFLEASKAMARGIGYAGEGDVLTASLVGALQRAFGRTTFTEIFCPDWKGGTLFISHMGEVNPEIAPEKPRLYEKPYPFSPAKNPAVITCAPAPGPAVLVNLAPGPNDSFALIIAPVTVEEDSSRPDMQDWVRGWLRPQRPVGEFLEQYSKLGGTHHCALVLGDRAEALEAFARYAGLPCETV